MSSTLQTEIAQRSLLLSGVATVYNIKINVYDYLCVLKESYVPEQTRAAPRQPHVQVRSGMQQVISVTESILSDIDLTLTQRPPPTEGAHFDLFMHIHCTC